MIRLFFKALNASYNSCADAYRSSGRLSQAFITISFSFSLPMAGGCSFSSLRGNVWLFKSQYITIPREYISAVCPYCSPRSTSGAWYSIPVFCLSDAVMSAFLSILKSLSLYSSSFDTRMLNGLIFPWTICSFSHNINALDISIPNLMTFSSK